LHALGYVQPSSLLQLERVTKTAKNRNGINLFMLQN
jgi:hypothetical protein